MERFCDLRLNEEAWSDDYEHSGKNGTLEDLVHAYEDNPESVYGWVRNRVTETGNEVFIEYDEEEDDDPVAVGTDYFMGLFGDKAEKDIPIYRVIGLSSPNDLNKEDLGVCWTFNPKLLDNITGEVVGDDQDYYVRLYALAHSDNIDWWESLAWFTILGSEEAELRVIDPSRLSLKGYAVLEKRNTEPPKLIHSNGEVPEEMLPKKLRR